VRAHDRAPHLQVLMKQQADLMDGTKENAALGKLERKLHEMSSPDQLCAEISRILRVKPHEVALLQLDKGALRFLYPPGLRTAGSIPLTGSAVAARTAATRTTMLSNSFAKVQHVRIFEGVKLDSSRKGDSEQPAPIQKMVSVPVFDAEGRVLGVIQVCRKGYDPGSAGADFSTEDLRLLEGAARLAATLAFLRGS